MANENFEVSSGDNTRQEAEDQLWPLWKTTRFWWTIGFISLMILISCIIGGTMNSKDSGIGAFAILFALFLASALKFIPAEPPHRGVFMYFGRRYNVKLDEGLNFLPGYPLIFAFIKVKVEKVNAEFKPEKVRTPDLAELTMDIALTFTPTDLIPYLNSGGEEGVTKILVGMVEEEARQWANNPGQAPLTWREAISANAEAAATIAAELAGQEVSRQIVRKLMVGNAAVEIPNLGITLNRLNVGKIVPQGELISAAEKMVVEEAQREGDRIEIQNVRDRIEELVAAGLSPEGAAQVVQTERGKITKTVEE